MIIRSSFFYSALLLCLLMVVGCTHDEDLDLQTMGKVYFGVEKISTTTPTRATPAELPSPVLEEFRLTAQRQEASRPDYDGRFQSEMELPIGQYSITASYGENPVIGRDTPYYIGECKAVVEEGKSAFVSIPCQVGNALVSVQFGRTEEEKARFERYYSDYRLMVEVDGYSMSIGKDETASSLYVQAGSSVVLTFCGTLLTDNDREVHTPLEHESLPATLQAADHLKLTLTLPNPSSGLGVNIGKIEVVSVDMDETIPLSWLPVARVTPTHQYVDGMLVGTNLDFASSYPGMTWEARISNASGDTIRRVQGQGALSSAYTSSAEWPYLPAGKYKATYFLHSEGSVSKMSSREFTVPAPELTVTLGGYTSHSKYLEGDIEGANASDGLKLYDPTVGVNIAPALIGMEKYAFEMTCNLDGTTTTATNNYTNLGTKTLDASLTPYVLQGQVLFAGEVVTGSREYLVTGIPFEFEPPTKSTWEASGKVTDYTDEGYCCLGYNAVAWQTPQTITYRKVAIPTGTRLDADYNIVCHSAAFKADFTFYVGDQLILSGKNNDKLIATSPITTENASTSIVCRNDGGEAQAYVMIYRVAMWYR